MTEVIIYKPEKVALRSELAYSYDMLTPAGLHLPSTRKTYPIRILSRAINGEVVQKRICLADDFLSRLFDDNVDAALRAQQEANEVRKVLRRYRDADFWERFKYLFTGIVR